ncbi:MAG TPA: glycolate oxidase subunit GlcF [Terriglobales bacterium]
MAEPAIPNPESGRGAFDPHHPPSTDLIDKCVHCGFCLATCPTYALWGEEMDSPRGRIYLMKLGLKEDGQVQLDPTFVNHMDNCLGCMACLTSCPSGVQYDKLIEATRAQIERNYPRPIAERILRKMLFEVFPRPERLRWLLGPMRIYQRSGLQSLVRRSGLLKLLPASLSAMENLMPSPPRNTSDRVLPERVEAQGERRLRVGLLLGCVQSVFFPEVNAATARVLAAEGCEVVIPKDQCCCGALMIHAGEEKAALDYARRTIDAFEGAQVDRVVSNAAGCGSNLKDYGYLLREDTRYAERAKAFSAKCRDISEVLAGLEPRAARHPLPLKVAYHDSCHLQHAQAVRTQPRAVLGKIPGLQILELAEAALCCGSAGIYNLVRPSPAQELGERKVRNVLATNPDIVVSGNPGCLLQLRSGLRASGSELTVVHMVELVDASIRGLPAESLRKRA